MGRALIILILSLSALGPQAVFSEAADELPSLVQSDTRWTFEQPEKSPIRAQLTRGLEGNRGFAKLELIGQIRQKLVAVLRFDQLSLVSGRSTSCGELVKEGVATSLGQQFIFHSDLIVDRVNETSITNISLAIYLESDWINLGSEKATPIHQLSFEPLMVFDVENLSALKFVSGHSLDLSKLSRRLIVVRGGEEASLPMIPGRQLLHVIRGVVQMTREGMAPVNIGRSEIRTLRPKSLEDSTAPFAASAVVLGSDTGEDPCKTKLRALGDAQIAVYPVAPNIPASQ